MVHLSHDPDVKVFLAVAWNWTHPWGTQAGMQHQFFKHRRKFFNHSEASPVICILLPNCVMWHDIHIWLLLQQLLDKTNHKFLPEETHTTYDYWETTHISNKIETWNLTAEKWHLLEVIERGLTNEIFTSVSLGFLLESVSGGRFLDGHTLHV